MSGEDESIEILSGDGLAHEDRGDGGVADDERQFARAVATQVEDGADLRGAGDVNADPRVGGECAQQVDAQDAASGPEGHADELACGRQAHAVEREVVGSPGVANRYGRRVEIVKRLEPGLEDRLDRVIALAIDAADAAGAVVRMINMGVESFLISSALLGVVAQRLVRVICSECQETYKVDKATLKKLSLEKFTDHFVRGKGCPKCLNSGYRGRQGIYELLVVDEEMRKIILECRSADELKARAKVNGMVTLRETGIEKVKEGITTPQEILRATQEVEEGE